MSVEFTSFRREDASAPNRDDAVIAPRKKEEVVSVEPCGSWYFPRKGEVETISCSELEVLVLGGLG